jgi:RNA polymerase sigma-70 factor (ECF subfamily)
MKRLKGKSREKKRDKDFELVKAINNGRQDRFHEIVREYEVKLFNFGLRMCGNVQDSEDMVQDTFLNVFKYLKDFRYETKFKNWLYRIAANTCNKNRRRSKYAPERDLYLEEFLPDELEKRMTDMPYWVSVPSEELLGDELSQVINDAILDLPEKYRVVLVLRDKEGFSTEEAAKILNLTPASIKVRLHRARLFLRDKLKGYFRNES